MIARKADQPFHDAAFGAQRAAFCETDDAVFVVGGLDDVFVSKELGEEFFCHCGRL